MSDWNKQIIDEFRANQGVMGGPFEGMPMLILHTTGRKTGRDIETPLVYLPDGDDQVVFASAAGSPAHPQWFLNLEANPSVTVELGSETVGMTARVVTGDERNALYARQVEVMPQFGGYQEDNPRIIPAIVLSRT